MPMILELLLDILLFPLPALFPSSGILFLSLLHVTPFLFPGSPRLILSPEDKSTGPSLPYPHYPLPLSHTHIPPFLSPTLTFDPNLSPNSHPPSFHRAIISSLPVFWR